MLKTAKARTDGFDAIACWKIDRSPFEENLEIIELSIILAERKEW